MLWLKYFDRRPVVKGRVSVLTATYNRPQTLAEAIASVQAQTYENWEQLVVSDGADPRVNALVRGLSDPRIRASHSLPCHTFGAYQRNCALRSAEGEFLMFLDDDNVIDPHCLATMVGGFDDPDVGFVVCPVRYGTNGIMRPRPDFKVQEIDTLNVMVRRELMVRVGGFGPRYSADFRMFDKVRRISRGRFLDTVIGHHR